MKPKIIMNDMEEITITKHFLKEYDCLLIYEKMSYEDTPVLLAIMELMCDVSYEDELIYILINYVDGSKRGIYPCDYGYNSWEDITKEYFSNSKDYYYIYKRNNDYTVNEEYYFK